MCRRKIGRKYAKMLTLMTPRRQDCGLWVFSPLALYNVWYFPCSVKMHVNYISEKKIEENCFPKIFMVIFHSNNTEKIASYFK